MNSVRSHLILILLVLATATNLHSQQRPLLTEDPRLLATGIVASELGMEYLNRLKIPYSGLGGNELSILVNGLHFGLGDRSEFQLTGVAHTVLWVKENGSGRRNDWGDFAMSTKIKLVDEKGRRPIVSFRPTVVLPNSSATKDIGADGTNVFGSLLFGKTVGRAFVHGSIGMGILDDTVRPAAQQDVLTYGLAVNFPVGSRTTIAWEWNGLSNPQSNPTPGGEDRGQIRAGFRVRAGGMRWDIGTTAGLTRLDAKWGLIGGMTREFRLWK